VDIVRIAAPRRSADIIAGFAPDLITIPLDGDHLSIKHLDLLHELTKDSDAVVIGGGIGRRNETMDAVLEFLRDLEHPVVIDADAIHAVARRKEVVKYKPAVLTPHAYEFYILSGTRLTGLKQKDRVKAVHELAEKMKATILLTSHVDIIADEKMVALNKTGNPYLTVGGTGDTLAGIIGSLLAQGNDLFTAACAAAFINGLAGDFAAKEKKQGVLAGDLLDHIPKAIKG
jgi:NAD(P)H-hydrate epimerase